MSLRRILVNGALLLAAVGLLAPAISAPSSALLTSTNTSLTTNTVATQSCSTSQWDAVVGAFGTAGTLRGWQKFGTLVSGSTNRYENSGGTVTGDYTGVPTAAGNQGQTGALYCSSDSALGFIATNDKVDSPTTTVSSWGMDTGPSTLMLWFKGTSAAAGTLAGFESTGGSGVSDRVLWMDASGNVKFSGTGGWTVSSSGTAYNDGFWHLASVVMGVAGSGTLGATLYVDGVQQATNTTGTYAHTTLGSSSAKWRIGDVSKTTVTGPTYATWLGTVDEFVVVDAELTATELGAATASRTVAAADITPPSGTGTAAVGRQVGLTSASLTAASASITGASVKPNASITEANLTPSKSISSLSVSPEKAISSAAINASPTMGTTSITPQKLISSLSTLPQATISGSISPQKLISVLDVTPRSTITSARIAPNATITSASIAPNKAISAASATPERAIQTASISPQPTITGSITPEQGISSVSANPLKTVTSAAIAPNVGISSAAIAPQKPLAALSIAPKRAIGSATVTASPVISATNVQPVTTVTAATVTPTEKTITATTLVSKALTQYSITASGATFNVKVSASSHVWVVNDWVYVDIPARSDLSGWRQITAKGANDFTWQQTGLTAVGNTAITTSNAFGTSVTLTAAAHGFAIGNTVIVAGANSSLNGTYTLTAVTTDTFTFALDRTLGKPTAATSGTATRPTTSAVYTATNTYAVGDTVTVTGLSGSGSSTVNVTGATITARDASSFTVTIPSYSSTAISLTSQTGTASGNQNSATITTSSAHGFVTGNIVSFTVPSTVTNYAQLDGKTCTVTSATTTTQFVCTLSSPATANISISASDRATATAAKAISSMTVTPVTTVTAASVTTTQRSISSSTVQTTSAATKVTISGTTGLKFTAAVPSGVTYGTTAGWKNGDYVYISGLAGCSTGTTANKCATGYDTATNGAWYPISNTGGNDITITIGSLATTYFSNCTGATGCVVTAGIARSTLITTTAAHGFVAADSIVINSASNTTAVPNGTYTVVSAPSTTTLTINPAGTSTTFGVPAALTAAGTITKPVTSAVFTATNTYAVGDTVTVTGLSGAGSSTVNVTGATITARDASSFTVTIPSYSSTAISLTSQTGTATETSAPTVTVTTSGNHGYQANAVLVLSVPSTVTNYAQLDGKTCTIGGSAPAAGSFTCTLGSAASANVSVTSTSDGATVSSSSANTVSINTVADHGLAVNDVITLAVPSTVTNYQQLNGKACTVATVPLTTSLTCTLASPVLSNVTITSGSGSTANLATATVAVTLDSSVAFTYTAGDQVTLYAPSTVTNYTLVDGQTCTVLASPAPTSTTMSCNLAATVSDNVSVTAVGDGASLASPLSTVQVTTSTAHGFPDGSTIAIDAADNTLDAASTVITVTGATTFTYQIGTPYSGTNITTTGTAMRALSTINVTTSTPHGYANGATVNLATGDATIDAAGTNATITVTGATTFTIPIAAYSGANIDVSGTATAAVTTITVATSAAHGLTVGAQPYLWVSGVTNADQLNGKTCTVTVVDSTTSFTCTLSSAVTSAVTVTSTDGASVSTGLTSLALTTTSTHSFAAGTRLSLSVPSSVTNYDQLNGKTCTVAASPAPTSTTLTCTLSSAALRNVTLTSGSGATASSVTGFTTTVSPASATITAIGVDPQKTISAISATGTSSLSSVSGTPNSQTVNKIGVVTSGTVYGSCGVSSITNAVLRLNVATKTNIAINDRVYVQLAGSAATSYPWAIGAWTICGIDGASHIQIAMGDRSRAALTETDISTTGSTYSEALLATTSSAHGITAGMSVVIAGTSVSGANGTYTVDTVPATTTFRYFLSGSSLTSVSATGGTVAPPTSTVTVTTSAAHGYTAGSSVTVAGTGNASLNGNFTLATASGTTFTYSTSTLPAPTSASSGTATSASTLVSVTASNSFTNGDQVTIQDTGQSALNGTFAIANRTASGFTYTLGAAQSSAITASTGTAAIPTSSVVVTTSTPQLLVAGDAPVLSVPSTVTNYQQLDGKACTVAASPAPTTSGFTCTLAVSVTKPVTLDGSSGATFGIARNDVTVTMAAAHSYVSGDVLTLSVPSTVTNYQLLDGKSCTVQSSGITSTGFTCTLTSGVISNVSVVSGDGAVAALPVSSVAVTTSVAHGFAANDTVTLAVPSSVTNYTQLNGKTCTVASPTTFTFTCALTSPVTKNITLDGTGSSAMEPLTTVSVAAPNSFSAGQSVSITTGNSTLDGTFTIATASSSGFTYAIPAYSGANIDVAGVALAPQTTVNVTTASAHTYTTGDSATISTGVTELDGSRTITVTSPTTFTFTIPSYSGANINVGGTATVGKTALSITTSGANGFAVGNAVTLEVPSSVTNYDQLDGKTCTVTATGTTFTCNLSSPATLNVSLTSTDSAYARFGLTALTVSTSAAHTFSVGNVATLSVPSSVPNYDQLDGKTCTLTASTPATGFTCTVSSTVTKNVTLGGANATGTATVSQSTLSVTTSAAHGFVATNVVTLEVPSSVTNFDQLNGKTCTVATVPTTTTLTCTLSSAATKNVTLTSADLSYATLGLSTLAVSTTATHSFKSGQTVVLQVPSTVTNYDALNGKTCLVLASPAITGTTFSCTLSSAATKNVAITSGDGATVTPEKLIASASLNPPVASIATAAITPVTTVTRGQISTTSATVSSLSYITGTITAIQTSGTTAVKTSINCKAVTGNKECGTAGYGFDTGDWLYVTLSGYPELSGWRQIGTTGAGFVNLTQSSATTINANVAVTGLSGTADQATITATTATAHGLAVADTVNMAVNNPQIDATGYAVVTAPTTTTFTFVLDRTLGAPSTTVSNTPTTATMTRWASTATITAANAYVAGREVTVAGFDDAGLNGTFVITSANATSFVIPLATARNGTVDESPAVASAVSGLDTLPMNTWTTHNFVANDVLTLTVPSSVDPNDQLDGKTCTVLASPAPTSTSLSCTLSSVATENVTVGISDGATATKGLTSLAVTTSVTHGFTAGQKIEVLVPSSVTNYEQVDGQSCTVAASPAPTATTFTCTLANRVIKQIDLGNTGATVALPLTDFTITTTAAHGYAAGNAVYVWVPSTVTNYNQVNGQTCTVLSAGLTTTQFTCTLSVGAARSVSVGSADGATVALPVTSLAVTTSVAHGFADKNAVTMVVPSSVTNYEQLNGKTCTVGKTPAITATTFTCALTSGVARNLTLTSGSGAAAKFAQTKVTVTAPAHGYATNDLATITTGNPLLDGSAQKITVVDANTFTYAVTSYSGANIITTGTATVPKTLAVLTVPSHGMTTGAQATIATGNATLDGTFSVTVVDANTLRYTIPSYSGTNITTASGTAVVWSKTVNVSAAAHGLAASQPIVLTGTGVTAFDGAVCTLANTTPAADSFSCDLATSYGTAQSSSTGFVNTYGTTATVTSPNSLAVGDTVFVSGAGSPFDSATGVTVTAATGTSFSYTVPSTVYTAASASWLTPARRMSVTTTAAHGLIAGDVVTITGSGAPFDGTWSVAAAPTATTLSLLLPTSTTTASSTATGSLGSNAMYASAGMAGGTLASARLGR